MTRPIRVAIIGAGPAGIYAGSILSRLGGNVSIDLFESLPAPYGLIRYGVAPDHPRIKGIVTSLHEMLDSGAIRLIGNVEFGSDISLDDLRDHYHAVIFATGANQDARMEIAGVDLPGSYGAADFVSWYDGHPDVSSEWPFDATEIAVLGNGNVALDVARVLAKSPDDLLTTDIPDNVYLGLRASPVTDVHIFGRRGPSDVKFTPIELRELGEVNGVDIVLCDEDFRDDAYTEHRPKPSNQAKVMTRIIQGWRQREQTGAPRRLHLHFFHNPIEIIGTDRVEGIRFERTALDADGNLCGTGEVLNYPVQAVYRAVGYHGSALPGVPFDQVAGIIPNIGGRVLSGDGVAERGLYATGWIKRGPVGLIGHTKSDAAETIENLLADRDGLAEIMHDDDDSMLELLALRGVRYTTWNGWLQLDAHERTLGMNDASPFLRERVKVVPREEQIAISRDGALVGS